MTGPRLARRILAAAVTLVVAAGYLLAWVSPANVPLPPGPRLDCNPPALIDGYAGTASLAWWTGRCTQ